ncbi:RNA-binding protein [Thalassobacillus sp. CUG 92003]|uniref:YlmH family RNA-binding protein n=1 Tax=Thalassobacillus sp. CUG 92003 TaxID=2736641 RepID=UPI0015E6FB01|nr:RNA-binding protein [Thalassobacillus sp. CUG 92003]
MDIYQHFRAEERPFIDQVLSWQTEVERQFQRKQSDFLDPREQYIFQSLLGNHPDLVWSMSGGKDHTERKRAILAPYYENIALEDFALTLLEAEYPEKFIQISHRDVLGAFMSLGIKRQKVGDLTAGDGKVQIVVASEISDFVKMNLTGIKKATLNFSQVPMEHMNENHEYWMHQDTTVSSLRLDNIVKEIYRISRNKAVLYIERGLVKVNFRTVEHPSFQMEAGDIISLRGKGRSKLTEIHGVTKKEKYKITTAKLK